MTDRGYTRAPESPWHNAYAFQGNAPVVDWHTASQRAHELLLSMLTQEQKVTYLTDNYFDVRGSAGGQYRIWNRGPSGNVESLDHHVFLCAHPPGNLPHPDVYLAQLLALATDEPGFRAIANNFGRYTYTDHYETYIQQLHQLYFNIGRR